MGNRNVDGWRDGVLQKARGEIPEVAGAEERRREGRWPSQVSDNAHMEHA